MHDLSVRCAPPHQAGNMAPPPPLNLDNWPYGVTLMVFSVDWDAWYRAKVVRANAHSVKVGGAH